MPAVSPTCSSTPCSAACCIICAAKPAAFRVHRHPCRRRPLRSRPAPEAARGRRMARRHRTADGGSAAGGGGGIAGALSRRRARAQSRRRAQDLSRLAGARARLAARQDRLIACELEPKAAAALAAQSARRRRASRRCASTAGPRSSAYVPPKERRGLVLIDPPFEEDGDFAPPAAAGLPRRSANGRPASTCSGIRSRPAASRTRWPSACAGSAIAKMLRAELTVAPMADPEPAQRLRPHRGQPALAAGAGACRPAAGAGRTRSAATATAASGWIGSPASARRLTRWRVAPFHRGRVGV